MPKTRPPYPPQLRARLIEWPAAGGTPEELGRTVRAVRPDDPELAPPGRPG
jgi:hypothetical protein